MAEPVSRVLSPAEATPLKADQAHASSEPDRDPHSVFEPSPPGSARERNYGTIGGGGVREREVEAGLGPQEGQELRERVMRYRRETEVGLCCFLAFLLILAMLFASAVGHATDRRKHDPVIGPGLLGAGA